jgi:hypothetical protein
MVPVVGVKVLERYKLKFLTKKRILGLSIAILPFIVIIILVIMTGEPTEEEIFQQKSENLEIVYDSCLTHPIGMEFDSYYSNCLAIANRNLSICRDRDTLCFARTTLAQALDQNNLQMCEDIQDLVFKNICQGMILNDETKCDIAPTNSDKKICLRFISSKSLLNKSQAKKFCEEFELKHQQIFCKTLLLKDIAICAEAKKDACDSFYYNHLAFLHNNVSLCDKINTYPEEVEECREGFTP